jgi:putative pyruvate formate lyase activating enzyme
LPEQPSFPINQKLRRQEIEKIRKTYYNTSMKDAMKILKKCNLCPRNCRVDRTRGERGYCGIADELLVAYYGPHFGEEPPISGDHGSGNIFFSSCNLRCVYCQNFQISHRCMGKRVDVHDLIGIFFYLQGMGAHNINLVSPTPYIPFIIQAIEGARKQGLSIPFVYNTHSYETVDTLRLLEGLIDVYLPDFKYWSSSIAQRLSSSEDYPENAKNAILEMKRQVGNLVIEEGLAHKGVLVRHLVLPSNLAGSRQILGWIKNELGLETHVSLMAQYNPMHRAAEYPMLTRGIRQAEYDVLLAFLEEEGFENVFIQELESAQLFVPNFECCDPFRENNENKRRMMDDRPTKSELG